MWNRKLATLILVAALLSAGCVGDVPSSTTETPDDPQTTAPGGEYPPGVTESGIENVSALLDAHRASVLETGYAYEYRQNVTRRGDDRTTIVERGAAAAGGTPFDRTGESVDSNSRYEWGLWANESVALVRTATGDGVRYDKRYREDGRDDSGPGERLFELEQILVHGAFSVADTTTDGGDTLTTLSASEYVGDETRNVTAFDARLVVDQSGRIHELTVDVRGVDPEGATVEEYHRYELTKHAVETVERPSWANEALSTADTLVRVDTEDNRFVTVTHRGGDVLSAGSTVTVEHGGETHVLELESALKTGNVVYVYFPVDGSTPVLVRDRPSESDAAEFDGEYSVAVADADGNRIAGVGFAVESASATAPPPTPTPTPDE